MADELPTPAAITTQTDLERLACGDSGRIFQASILLPDHIPLYCAPHVDLAHQLADIRRALAFYGNAGWRYGGREGAPVAWRPTKELLSDGGLRARCILQDIGDK